MKIEVKNKELLVLLNMINGFSNAELNVKCAGLRNEAVTLGVKVRLSKIDKELMKNLKEFEEAKKSKIDGIYSGGITQEIEKKAIEDKDPVYLSLIKEINECADELVSIEFDPIDMSKVEDIVTTYDYSYLLEKITE